MSRLDHVMARHAEIWHSVARYSVYKRQYRPENILAVGLRLADAKDLAQQKSDALGGYSNSGIYFGVQLENKEEANAAVREADVWSGLKEVDLTT